MADLLRHRSRPFLARGFACWFAVTCAVAGATGGGEDAALRALADRVRPSVVEIVGTVEETGDTSYGTGFAVEESDLVVTNAHVVRGVRDLMIRTWEGAAIASVRVLHVDSSVDLAVLRVVGLRAPPLVLAADRAVAVGERVVAVGHPRGYEYTVSEGIVSALRSLDPDSPVLIQTTAPISPGSSGGPLLDLAGRVVGVCSLTLTEGQNINFAVPAADLVPVLERARRIEASLASPDPRSMSAEDLARAVRRHREEGDLVRARELARRALEVHRESVALLLEAAEVAWARGSYPEVAAILSRIEAIAPDFAPARRLRAAYLLQSGDCDGAVVAARQSLAGALDDEQRAEAHAVIGECLGRAGEPARALEHVDRALASDRIAALPDFHALRAVLLASLGRIAEADREAIVALDLADWDPLVVAALRERGLPRLVDVVTRRLKRDRDRVVAAGVVRNVGPIPLSEVTVTAEGLDDQGDVVATGTGLVEPSRLVPGQTGAFAIPLAGLVEDVTEIAVRVLDYRER